MRTGEYLRCDIYDSPYEEDRFDVIYIDFRSAAYSSPCFGVEANEDLRRVWSYGLRRDGRSKVVTVTFATRGSPNASEVARMQQDAASAYGWTARCVDTFKFVENASEVLLLTFSAKEVSMVRRAVSTMLGWTEQEGNTKKRKR